MLFRKQLILESKLEALEIIARINSVTSSALKSDSNKIKFEGIIGGNDFKILPSFNYSANNRVRPEIQGKIIENNNSGNREIHLRFSFSQEMKWNFLIAFVINSIFLLIIFICPEALPIQIRSYWWLIIIAILIFLVACIATLTSRINESIRILIRLLNAHEK